MKTDYAARRMGKSEMLMELAKAEMRQGKNVVFGASNQKRKIGELLKYFPSALITVIGDNFLRVHERFKRR